MRLAAAITAATLLVPSAARAEDPAATWRSFRDWLLGSGQPELQAICAIGRQLNARQHSHQDPGIAKRYTDTLLSTGHDPAWISASRAGLFTAMNQACPDVW
ncbi:MAG: hypothetical protein AAFX65_09270 [Cyanobacteria bacterium J06638_7]